MGSAWVFLCLTAGLFFFSINLYASEATEFLVGGNKENSWRIPTYSNELNDWAQKERFRIGDSLVFQYDSKTDSVLRVNEENYKKCNKTNPLKSYHDGNTKIKLDEAGPFFFISGANGHCEKGEKLEVKVLSPKHGSVGGLSPSQAPKASPIILPPPVSTPVINSPPVHTPATAPTASAASLLDVVIGVSALSMVVVFAFAMV